MKMRKLGALLMAGVMAVSILLAGCGNGASGNISDGNSAQTENADRGERKKITILMRASETSAKCIIMKKLLTEFSEEKGLEPPEFEMISSSDADYMTKLQLYINSNTLPDIYDCANGALSEAARNIGGIVNIGDELERIGKKDGMNAAVYDFFKDKEDGNVYLFPESLYCEFFFYRKDIFDKYNLKAPTTWNEFLEVCQTLKDNGEIPLIVAGKENWQLMRYLSFAPWRMTKDQFIMDYMIRKISSLKIQQRKRVRICYIPLEQKVIFREVFLAQILRQQQICFLVGTVLCGIADPHRSHRQRRCIRTDSLDSLQYRM